MCALNITLENFKANNCLLRVVYYAMLQIEVFTPLILFKVNRMHFCSGMIHIDGNPQRWKLNDFFRIKFINYTWCMIDEHQVGSDF